MKDTAKIMLESEFGFSTEIYSENKLYDVHFYVFNTKGEDGGELIGYEQLVFDGYIPPTLQNGNTVPQSISIRAKTGEAYIYAVANINNGANYSLTEGNSNLLNVTQGATIDKTTLLPIEYTEGEGDETKDLKKLVENPSSFDSDLIKQTNEKLELMNKEIIAYLVKISSAQVTFEEEKIKVKVDGQLAAPMVYLEINNDSVYVFDVLKYKQEMGEILGNPKSYSFVYKFNKFTNS